MSCANAEGFWTICSDATTKFQNVGKPVLTKSGNSEIAVKRRGELVCKDTWDKSINIVTYTDTANYQIKGADNPIRLQCII